MPHCPPLSYIKTLTPRTDCDLVMETSWTGTVIDVKKSLLSTAIKRPRLGVGGQNSNQGPGSPGWAVSSSGCSWALWLKQWAGLNGFVMMYF